MPTIALVDDERRMLRFELDVVKIRGPMCQMKGVAKVDGGVVAEADMAAMLRDR